ncbi:MAG: MBL fold metallo-hydrolase, partial [Chloroflexi bacterium]|nr:MBL fold metallo-hydrolase [Chloroflexota bacterium]
DAGLDYDEGAGIDSWGALMAQARAQGIEPEAVRVVIITHEHIDHAGLAARWAKAGARIVVGRSGIETLVLGAEANERQREPRFADLTRHGAPDDMIEVWRAQRRPRALRWAPCPPEALAAAEDCDPFHLAGGVTLSLLMAPGHTPGNLVAYVPETGSLFSGDTVIPTTIPTAGLHYPGAVFGDEAAGRWPSLPPFLRSVAALRALAPDWIYPGHGEIIERPEVYLDRFEQHHLRRAQLVCRALGDESRSAFEITRKVFPRLPAERLMQAMTEVLGHLDLLAEASAVDAVTNDGATRWRLSGDAR